MISVVVTCYNYGRYVAGALESVQNQTYSDFEVIVINDGSTDDSEEQIEPFLHDKRYRYIKQENSGQAKAKNRGIVESKGEFIAFLDADDLWLKDKLKEQIQLFAKSDVGVVYSLSSTVDRNGRALPTGIQDQFLQPRRGKVTEYLIYDNFVPFSSVIVRRQCFDSLGMFDEELAMGIDWDLWLRFSTAYKFDYSEKKFLLYRVGHSGQMSRKILERIHCADKIVEKFREDFPGILPKSKIKDSAYYSCCLRGYALRRYGIKYPIYYYLKAISLFPFRKKAYLGLLKAPFLILLGR